MARYHGKGGRLYMSATGSGAAEPVASLSRWSLDMSTERADTTSFEDGNKTSVQGFPAVRGQFAGFFDSAEDAAFAGQQSVDGVKLYLYPALAAPTIYWYGPAWVDYSLDVNVSGAVPITGTFEANGSWGKKP